MEEQEGFGNAPCRAGEGTPGVPAESTGAKRSRSAQLVRTGSSLSPAVLAAAGAPLGCAAQTPAGRRREGKVRGSEAAAGSRTHVPSACWRRLRGAGVLGDLRPSGAHIAFPAPGRTGQGRAGLRAAPTVAGVCPSLASRAGPSSRCRVEANGAPSPPTRRAASPPRVAAGAGGREGLGGTGLRAPLLRLS